MVPHRVRVNTFFLIENTSSYVDTISKSFLFFNLIFGLNRIPVIFSKPAYIALSFAYSVIITCVVLYLALIDTVDFFVYDIAVTMNLCEFCLCNIYGFMSYKRLKKFYDALHEFDVAIGCKYKATKSQIFNLTYLFLLLVADLGLFIYLYEMLPTNQVSLEMIPVYFTHVTEIFFFGHLLSLLHARLHLINMILESSIHDRQLIRSKKLEFNRNFNPILCADMKNIMNLYTNLTRIFFLLVDAIKWQFLIIIMTSFVCILFFAFFVTLNIIQQNKPLAVTLPDFVLTVSVIFPLFSPCAYGDKVQSEVCKLKELVTATLYKNKLSKTERSIARALLHLTEARNLSFSLLRVLSVDISLPFKFISLLITYLIILLQFEKVISA